MTASVQRLEQLGHDQAAFLVPEKSFFVGRGVFTHEQPSAVKVFGCCSGHSIYAPLLLFLSNF